jgi:spermidine synthase
MNATELGKYRVADIDGRTVLRYTDDEVCDLSTMDPTNPAALDDDYTRVMLHPLVFLPTPKDLLLIGLGGGQQAKFLYRYFPALNLTAVEIDPTVVELARTHFRLPEDDERLQVVVRDAVDYMHDNNKLYDLIVSDAYGDGNLMVDALHTASFYQACHRNLRAGGVMTVNILRPRSDWVGNFVATLSGVFAYWQFHVVSTEQGVIVLWKDVPVFALESVYERAAHLDAIANLNFTGFVDAFRRKRDSV